MECQQVSASEKTLTSSPTITLSSYFTISFKLVERDISILRLTNGKLMLEKCFMELTLSLKLRFIVLVALKRLKLIWKWFSQENITVQPLDKEVPTVVAEVDVPLTIELRITTIANPEERGPTLNNVLTLERQLLNLRVLTAEDLTKTEFRTLERLPKAMLAVLQQKDGITHLATSTALVVGSSIAVPEVQAVV
jgi:hypothetical protein